MPRLRVGHSATASALIGLAVAGLLAVQQLANVAAFAESPRTNDVVETTPAFRGLPVAEANLTTYAAVQPGLWEDLYKPTPVPTPAPTLAPTVAPTPVPVPTEAPRPRVFETGIASTYGTGDGFEGNRTACGQIFRTRVVQVAHKTLPCGTLLRIEDVDTGLTVDAEVTDRGPYIPGRIVDLSWGAFSQLDQTAPGLLRVNVYLLDK